MAGRLPRGIRVDRIILHFDYDCFYASVFEAADPSLKTRPLAVQQKQIIVTCNYEARRRGLHKLQLIRDARRICPDVVIVLGEDLTRFRDASKELYHFLRAYSWNGKVERLGFDEVFMDVSDLVDYNIATLNQHDLANSFFCLDREDPTVGFAYDAATVAGCGFPASDATQAINSQTDTSLLRLRLNLGSHLARHLQGRLEEVKGYTSSVGVSTSKLLAKLVGNVTKPRGLTTLVPPYEADEDGRGVSNVTSFIDSHEIGRIPGIGTKLAQKLRDLVLGRPARIAPGLVYGRAEDPVTVQQVRELPGMSIARLDSVLRGAGSQHDIATVVWGLVHGIDDSAVAEARDVPRQISIEDSYLQLNSIEAVTRELRLLAISLIKRMHADLLGEDEPGDPPPLLDASETAAINPGPNLPVNAPPTLPVAAAGLTKRWLAHPKTLRLTTRPRPPANPDGSRARSFNRISRSAPVPAFLFSQKDSVAALADRLVADALLPMFRKLHPERGGWDLSLVNVGVTNMADAANDSRRGAAGRDIGRMFERQEDVLRPWKVAAAAAEQDEDDQLGDADEAKEERGAPPADTHKHLSQPSADDSPSVVRVLSHAQHAPSHRQHHHHHDQAAGGSEDMLPPTQDSRGDESDARWLDDVDEDYGDAYAMSSELMTCEACGACMPAFAAGAHARFHELGG